MAPGGTLVYSTCTFAKEENEEIIAEFISEHPQFSVITVGGTGSFAPGFGELSGTARLWPHKVKGEGHFMAVLQHVGPKVSAEERDQAEVKLSAVTRNTNKKALLILNPQTNQKPDEGKKVSSLINLLLALNVAVKVQEKSKPWPHMEIL